METATARG
uniref:Uncharacterized protein n=1 Tax=Arundo donax TaxID=35708 RepID=A0A0A9F7X2_ARUDO